MQLQSAVGREGSRGDPRRKRKRKRTGMVVNRYRLYG